MTDKFLNSSPDAFQMPADDSETVIPSDTINMAQTSRGLYVGVGGDVTAVMAKNGKVELFKNVPQGAILPYRVTRVNATGTTASYIVSLL